MCLQDAGKNATFVAYVEQALKKTRSNTSSKRFSFLQSELCFFDARGKYIVCGGIYSLKSYVFFQSWKLALLFFLQKGRGRDLLDSCK